MTNFDGNVTVNISLDAPSVSTVGFGTVLIAGDSMGVGFTQRSRFYASAADASADTDLGAALIARVTAAFAQLLKPVLVAVGRVGLVADVWNVDLTAIGANLDTHVVTVLGQTFTHISDGAETLADQVDALKILIDAASLPVTVTDNGDDFDVTATNTGQPLGVTYAQTGACAGVAANSTPAVTMNAELALVAAEDNDWYGIALESRKAWNIEQAAIYAQSNDKLFVAQSSDADILTTATDDIASTLQTLTYTKSGVEYHADDLEFADVAWLANRLSVNPDNASTTWAKVMLVGVTPQDAITSTAKANLLGKNANVYLTLLKVGATGAGTVASGEWIDVVVTADWLKFRLQEDIAQTLLNASNRGDKVPFTDQGINIFGALVESRLDQGSEIGHFIADTAIVNLPALADFSTTDRNNRHLAFTFSVQPAGAIHTTTINGNVSLTV